MCSGVSRGSAGLGGAGNGHLSPEMAEIMNGPCSCRGVGPVGVVVEPGGSSSLFPLLDLPSGSIWAEGGHDSHRIVATLCYGICHHAMRV